MKIHYIQHVSFEGPASIGQWAEKHEHILSGTKVYENEEFPDGDAFDWLVVVGGPMGVYDENEYPWIRPEKEFIRKAINSGKTIVGICLGAQLIADVLGAKVFRNHHKEIGWFPIELTTAGMDSRIFGHLSVPFTAFHWHGDSFSLPPGAIHLARSEACENQAFLYEGRVLGLQFHLESTPKSVLDLAHNCRHELVPGAYIQSYDQIVTASPDFYEDINQAMFGILDLLSEYKD